MDWTLEENMVDGLFFCATLTSRRGGHTPFVQAGAETSGTGAEAVGAGVVDESAESYRVLQPLRLPLVIRPLRRTYVVVVR